MFDESLWESTNCERVLSEKIVLATPVHEIKKSLQSRTEGVNKKLKLPAQLLTSLPTNSQHSNCTKLEKNDKFSVSVSIIIMRRELCVYVSDLALVSQHQ